MSDIAINPVTRRVQFTGNTGTGPYAFNFNVLQSSDIVVYKNNVLLTETTDYTVSIAANGTGNITMVVALVLTDILTIIGGRELSRTTDFVTAGDLLASSLNEQLDSNVIMSQQLDERFGRTLKVPPGDEDKILDLPLAASRADKVLTFDTEGNVVAENPEDLFAGAIVGANYILNTGTGDGSTTVFSLTAAPGVKTNIQVYIDGVYQDKASFSISGQTFTFSEAPPLNSSIEFIIGQAVTQITGDASAITYDQGGTGSVERTLRSRLQETISVKDFGAVGDGVADDAAAIQAAVDAAAAHQTVVGVSGENYRIASTLNFNGVRFDGRFCTITKDFDGVGINITGAATYTYLYNFNINASATYTATDYSGSATSHGIKVNGTRVEAYYVGSSNHNGAGWWLEVTANMNKSKYIRIVGGNNARAGAYLSGTDDNMSVWEFNGRFQSNKGYGLYITNDCTLRDSVFWIYAEANQTGASFPAGEYAVYMGKMRKVDVWAYVEQQSGTNLELKVDTNCESCRINSVRNNDDIILGTNIAYVRGNKFMDKDGNRAGTPFVVTGQLSRMAQNDEYVQIQHQGNDGTFGFIRGEGNSSGDPFIGLRSSDGAAFARINNDAFVANTASFQRLDAGRGINETELDRTVPTSNQVTLTVTFADTTSKFGSGMLEIFLCADTDATALDAIYLGHIPVSVRAGTSTMTTFTKIDTKATNITVNASYPTVSGVTMTVVFDCHADIDEVMGHVKMRGGEAYMTSATLS